jgi:regulatory protein
VSAAAKAIKETCLRWLARREHSQKELFTKCVAKGFAQEDILPIIDELARQGWQDDNRYAESYARHRIQKGYGPVAVLYELKQNGVGTVNLDDAVQSVAGSWLDLLEQVYHKKYTRDIPLSRQEWAKRSRFLLQRGFTPDLINALRVHLSIKFP